MRRIGIVLIALLPLAAWAKWNVFDVPGGGTGATVWLADGGALAVANGQGAYLVGPDGGVQAKIELDAGTPVAMQDAFVDARGCFAAVPKNTSQTYVIYADPACGETSATTAASVANETPVRIRRVHGGPLYLVASNGASGTATYVHVGLDGTASSLISLPTAGIPVGPSKALGVLGGASGDVAMFGLKSPGNPLGVIADAGTPSLPSFGATEQVPTSLAAIDSATALLTDGSGELVRVADLAGTPSWSVLPVSGTVQAVGFAPDTDLDHIGLGMVGATAAQGPLQFAVPLANAPGTVWAVNATTPTYAGAVQDVDCDSTGRCAAATDAADAGNLVVYENAFPPSWSLPSVVWTDAGTTVSIPVSPTDPDGDPLAVQWTAAAPLTVTPQDPQGLTVDVDVPASTAQCQAPYADFAVQGTLTDGLEAHRTGGELTVRVPRIFSPLSDATATLDAGYASGEILGAVDATGLNCPIERGLTANLALSSSTGDAGTAQVGPLPATFTFPRDTCAAQTYRLTAQLVDGDGGLGPTAITHVDVPAQPAGVDGVSGGPLVARCGEGATGTLTVQTPPGTCSAQTVGWTQQGGPGVTLSGTTGEAITVATQDTQLEPLIGNAVSLLVTASTGGDTVTRTVSVPITTEPFVLSDTRIETPTPQGGVPFGVSVTVTNPTACGLSSTSVVEQVFDATLVPGSAKVDGRPAQAHQSGDQVVVEGVPLEAGGAHRVSFDLRPNLIGAPAARAQVVFRGVPISKNSELENPQMSPGCSCRSASGGWEPLGYALLAGLWLIRRRRHAT